MFKSRGINNFHHAKDAYLNIVVGNVFHTKFTEKFFRNITTTNYSLNENALYSSDITKGDYVAWSGKESIGLVRKVMEGNNILFTRKPRTVSGGFFDETIYKAGQGEFAVKNPTDKNKITHHLTDLTKYGGFKKVAGAYFCVVEHEQKGKRVRSIEFVPIHLANKIENDLGLLEEYLVKQFGLKDIKIILPKLPFDSLINIDGFPMHLSQRTNVQIGYKGAVQLILNNDDYEYMRRLEKFVGRLAINDKLKISEYDKIDATKNLELYDVLLFKLENTAYKIRLSSVAGAIRSGREEFIKLTLENQCKVLVNMLNLFACNVTLTDISLIKGAKKTGSLLTSKTISNYNKVILIHQSVTGMFENRRDLLAGLERE